MTPEEKKLEKLNALFEMINEDYATPNDLIQLSETILGILQTEREKLAGNISDKGNELLQELDKRIVSVQNTINRLTYETEQSVAKIDNRVTKTLQNVTESIERDIKRLERKIPTKTDISGLEREIADIKDSFNSFPTELTVNNEAIRDGLELLVGDERLDRSAIKGLDGWDEIIALAQNPQNHIIAGAKLLRYLNDVNIDGITDGQTLVWDTTTGKFIPGSAGSGSGHVIEDEGTPLTTRTKLNFVGAGVTVTDDAGDDATVVTIPSATGTLQTVTDAGSTTTNDVEITDTTKGVILKSADGTRWRIGITNGGALTAVSL
jgi:hypothetical protein